jgi:hypothetical protein
MLVFDLDGQKVLSADRRVDETVLEFDLGTTLRMGKSMFPGDMESALWSISLWEGLRASLSMAEKRCIGVRTGRDDDVGSIN